MPPSLPAGADGLPDDPAGRVKALLEEIVARLGLEAEVSVEEGGEELAANVEGEDVGLLIGRHGQTIDAIQLLCYQAAFRGRPERKRVTVDAAQYRHRRAEALVRRADMAAQDAITTGREQALEPMSASERRVVHEHLRDRTEIETYSEGDEPNRFLVIAPLLAD